MPRNQFDLRDLCNNGTGAGRRKSDAETCIQNSLEPRTPTDFKPVCISAVPVLANSVTSVPLRQAAGLGDAALLFGPDLDSASRTILSGCRRVPSNLPETDCLLKQVWHVQELNL